MGWLTRSFPVAGGLFLPEPAEDTFRPAVRRLRPPGVLRVPLVQLQEEPSRLVVSEGQTVAPGDLLAERTPTSGRVHSPVPGTVGPTARVDTPYRADVPAVEIVPWSRGAKKPDAETQPGAPLEAGALSPGDFLQQVAEAGIDLPQSDALAEPGRVRWVIVAGLDFEPYQTANVRTLADHADDVVWTATLLHNVFGARRTCIVVDGARRSLARRLRGLARPRACRQAGHAVRVVGVATKYPLSAPKLLVKTVTGREVPYGQEPIDIRVWIIDVCALMDIYRALAWRRAHTWQTVTVAGDAVAAPGNYRVPLGIGVREMVDQIGLRAAPREIVVGSLLSGRSVATPDTVLTKRTRCVTVWAKPLSPHREPVSCIRCGACLDACPVGLDPRGLLDLAERGRWEAAAGCYPHACVDCGLCDYVCPSLLPLMRSVQECRNHVRRG